MKRIKKFLLTGEHVCPWWLAYTFDNPLRRIFHRPERILRPHLREGMTAVDIGCGMGYFSIAMAEIVGEQGLVIAVDIQQKMLDVLAKRASTRNVSDRICFHLCTPDSLDLKTRADFALTFWMVHEVSEPAEFLSQIHSLLKTNGKYLLVEPRIHVSSKRFQAIVEVAAAIGFETLNHPTIAFSRAVMFKNRARTSIGLDVNGDPRR